MVSLRYRTQCVEQEVRAERLRSARCIGSMISIARARDYERQKASQGELVRQELRRRWEQERQAQLSRTTALLQDVEQKRGTAMREAAALRRALHSTAEDENVAWQAEYCLEDARHRLALATQRTAQEMRNAEQTARRKSRRAVLAMERQRTASISARTPPATLHSALATLASPHAAPRRRSFVTTASLSPRVADKTVDVSPPPRAHPTCLTAPQKQKTKTNLPEAAHSTDALRAQTMAAQKSVVQHCGDEAHERVSEKRKLQDESESVLTPRPRRETPRPTLSLDHDETQQPAGRLARTPPRRPTAPPPSAQAPLCRTTTAGDVPRPGPTTLKLTAAHDGGGSSGPVPSHAVLDDAELGPGRRAVEAPLLGAAPTRYRARQRALILAREAAEDFRRVFVDTPQIILRAEEADAMADDQTEHFYSLETLLQPIDEADLLANSPLCRLPVRVLPTLVVGCCEEQVTSKVDQSVVLTLHTKHDAPASLTPPAASAVSPKSLPNAVTAHIVLPAESQAETATSPPRHQQSATGTSPLLGATSEAVHLADVTNVSLSSSTSSDGGRRGSGGDSVPSLVPEASPRGTYDTSVLSATSSQSPTPHSHRSSVATFGPLSEPTEYDSTTPSNTPSRIARPTMTAEQLRIALIRLRNRMRLAQM